MQDFPTTPQPQGNPQQGQQTPQPGPNQPPFASPPPTAPAPSYAPTYASPGGQQPQNPPQSNRNKLLIGGGIGCGVLLVLCMCMGLLGAIMAQGGSSSTSSNPTATAQQGQTQKAAPTTPPTATPKPTATPNPNAGAPAYAKFVAKDSTTLGNDLTAVGDACGQDLGACRTAWVKIRDDSASFLSDLDSHSVPPCMQTADKSLRAALNDIHAASLQVIDGIDQFDVDKINDGAATMRKATTEVNDATSALENANCS